MKKHPLFLVLVVALGFCFPHVSSALERPNILWLTSEDHGPEMGCYGDSLARTPSIDALASKGMIFQRVWSVAPVCAPARTAIISGMYPSSTGGIHMRSMVGMPTGTTMFPELLRASGYYCTNNSKTDYNLREPGKTWDASSNKAHWKNRSEGKPFFAVFNSTKSHESQIRTRPHVEITDPSKVRVPAYHPDNAAVRKDWAQYYDKVSEADADAGRLLTELDKDGLSEDTIIFYFGDHGSGMPRSKRWPSNSGLHVPMVVYFPKKWEHLAPAEYKMGGKSNRMISFVDLAPTVLSLAGIKPPDWLQGNAFAGPHQSSPQPFLFGERGRMDERMDLVRSVTDGRYVYLRNFMPHVSQAQRVAYQFDTPTTQVWHDLFVAGKTNAAQSIFWKVPKASEELYDLTTDRDEVHNLAASPDHGDALARMRLALREHILTVRDVGFLPEREMHSRSGDLAPYDMSRDPSKYALQRTVDAAELSSQQDKANLAKLVVNLSDRDSAIRYWGAMGLLMLGKDAVMSSEMALKAALSDECPDVRIVVAQALAKHGKGDVLEAALKTVGDLVSPEENGVLTAMSALAAVESLGEIASSLHGQIGKLSPNGKIPDQRYNSYVPRLIENIVPAKMQKQSH